MVSVMILSMLSGGTILTGLCCFPQVWLSKQETRWYGLVLPLIHVICTVFFMMTIFAALIFTEVEVGSGSNYVDGQSQYVVDQIETNVTMGEIFSLVGVFFLLNFPTAIYLLIYRFTKRNLSKFEELTRMTVLDLE